MKNYQRINYTFYTNKVLYVDHMILENEKTILQFLLISILILILQRCKGSKMSLNMTIKGFDANSTINESNLKRYK